MRFPLNPWTVLKSLRREIRRARFRKLLADSRATRTARNALKAARWDFDMMQQRLEQLEREHSQVAQKLGKVVAIGSHNDLTFFSLVNDLNSRVTDLQQRLGVPDAPVDLTLDLSAIAQG